MSIRPKMRKVDKRQAYLGLLVLTAVCFVLVIGAGQISRQVYLDDELTRGRETLRSHATNLQSTLDKYRVLTPVLARMPDVERLLDEPDNPSHQEAIRLLSSAQNLSGVTRLEVLNAKGLLLAGVRDDRLERSVQGVRGDAFRDALQGRLGRDFVTEPDGQRAYVFAAPVRARGAVIGVLRVRVPLEDIEQAWALSRDPILAIDGLGRIFLTNQAEWRLRNFQEVTGRAPYHPDLDTAQLPALDKAYRNLSQDLPLLGWRLHMFVDVSQARALSTSIVTISALVALFLVLGAWVLTERFIRRNVNARKGLADALRLERKVRDRTRDLTSANRQLAHEVRDREAAEEELRKTQAELVQSAKLAALGQMSAMIAHEFNQPLAALRSYTDNTRMLLDMGKVDKADETLVRVLSVTDRMGKLGKSLKTFARKPDLSSKPVPVSTVVDEMLLLLKPRADKEGVRLELDLEDGLEVLAGAVRLGQVLVNLASNALDVFENEENKVVRISARSEGNMGLICVTDNGPGIDPDLGDSIFDPFVTSKSVGSGLGLGLPIAYNIIRDFGGRLSIASTSDEGTMFEIRLPRVMSEKDAE
ncbi:sensor histidine kinase [Coralliovum pocilloporae]|uniref:sensor histidine kinase n=1 Tax=Coralliovum pocilloporae TaxID=3066369 RepID=UPI0033074211